MKGDVKARNESRNQNYVAASCNLGKESELILKICIADENVDADRRQLYAMLPDVPELHVAFYELSKVLGNTLRLPQGDQRWWYGDAIPKPECA